MRSKRAAFTLVEVMVSVMIISIVIMALLEMHGNSTNLFRNIKERLHISFFPSLFIANSEYGYENKTVFVDGLVKEFPIDDNIHRELKDKKIDIVYKQLSSVESPAMEENATLNRVFYTGKTTLKLENSSVSFLRITTRGAK